MSNKVLKKNNIKGIVAFLLLALVSAGVYYMYNKESKDKTSENGSIVSGYILEDGAEPGLSEEEIRELLQRQVDESTISFSISSETPPMAYISFSAFFSLKVPPPSQAIRQAAFSCG